MTTSEKLIYLRKREGLTQEQLAEKIGVSRQALSKWESGDTLPDTINILSLSKLFGVSTDYLLNDEFESDRDLPAVKENGRILDGKWRNLFRAMIGVWLMLIPAISMLIMGIIASVRGYEYYEAPIALENGASFEGGRHYYGLRAMLPMENLTWLFWLLIAMMVIGAGIIIIPWLKKKFKK